jgi:hypothetical protein
MGEFEATRKNRDEKKEEGSEWHQESRFPRTKGHAVRGPNRGSGAVDGMDRQRAAL